MNKILLLSLSLSLLGLLSCSNAKKLKRSKLSEYQQIIEDSPVFKKSFTGFHLFDPESGIILHSKNGDLYFNPASNTKLLTFYTCLNLLGDSIPGIRYLETGDSVIFWGTGDPSLAHPYLSSNDRVFNFLKKQKKKLFFSSANFKDHRFGSGWQWDDYYFYYQAEKAALPYHANVIKVDKEENDPYFRVEPGYFSSSFSLNDSLEGNSLKRISDYNIFEYNKVMQSQVYANEHPFIYSDELIINLVTADINKPIGLLPDYPLPHESTKYIYSVAVDTLYRRLLQESDNFIAEQLLLLCSDAVFGNLETAQIIEYATDSLIFDLPDEAIWADASGLSRYNLFTPRSIVYLLDKIRKKIPEERLFHLFPTGGVSGTIEDWYAGEDKPFVFAKTGTLSNNHCLSGYLITASGKPLIFSFMHNNYKGDSKPFKQEMERVLRAIYAEE